MAFGDLFKRKRKEKTESNVNAKPKPVTSTIPSPPETPPDRGSELLPIATLLAKQQSRIYYTGIVSCSQNYFSTESLSWETSNVSLIGSTIKIESPSTFINVSDCQLTHSDSDLTITITITDQSHIMFQFNKIESLQSFFSALILSKFEYSQLQKAYTGALLSSKAIHFSDVRILLDPNNRHTKEEWCVIRLPYLNDKWIRIFVVVKSTKVELYTNSNKQKKNLLGYCKEAKGVWNIYSGLEQVDENSLIRVFGDWVIDFNLLEQVLLPPQERRRSGSLSKRLSMQSMRSSKSQDSTLSTNLSTTSNSVKKHRRLTSIDTSISQNSQSTTQTSNSISKKIADRETKLTSLLYLIPESHPGVKPVEICIRLLIPLMNTFGLYGRPKKFVSSRDEKESLLFGLPQLPRTNYLQLESVNELVALNWQSASTEDWGISDWLEVVNELLGRMIAKGWIGSDMN
ncbi:Tph3 protein [Martiniozyma asiatica (nom. inval.)]|nr:Tph3 protein [Martiniozyma asiatica]